MDPMQGGYGYGPIRPVGGGKGNPYRAQGMQQPMFVQQPVLYAGAPMYGQPVPVMPAA